MGEGCIDKTQYRTLTLQWRMNIRWCHELCCECVDLGWLEENLILLFSNPQKLLKWTVHSYIEIKHKRKYSEAYSGVQNYSELLHLFLYCVRTVQT